MFADNLAQGLADVTVTDTGDAQILLLYVVEHATQFPLPY